MNSRTTDTDEQPKTYTYELVCTDCEFETTVVGTVYDALDEADSHQEEQGKPLMDHFVTFKLSGDG